MPFLKGVRVGPLIGFLVVPLIILGLGGKFILSALSGGVRKKPISMHGEEVAVIYKEQVNTLLVFILFVCAFFILVYSHPRKKGPNPDPK